MNTLGIVGIIVAGVVSFGGLLLAALARSQRQKGALEEQQREQQAADIAKERANKVLAQHRDIDDATNRLRDGTF